MSETRAINPAQLAIGGFLLLLGLAMTGVVIYGLFAGGKIAILLALWPITGGLPLWGGWRALQRGLGRAA